jgi:hypothetical protein
LPQQVTQNITISLGYFHAIVFSMKLTHFSPVQF